MAAPATSHRTTLGDTADWVLALDQGGHATRAIVYAADGCEQVRAEAPIATARPRPGWVEHAPDDLLASFAHCLDALASGLRDDVARVGIAALATQRSSVVCWSLAERRALTPVLSWQDVRAAAELQALALDPNEIHAITGLRVSPHYGASKLRWCLRNVPEVQTALARGELAAAPLASWLVHALTAGERYGVDPCNASRTLLWDVRTRDWSPRLLATFGVPRALLPPCLPNRADWAGLRLGGTRVPLGVVTGDQSAVPYAFDAPAPGDAYVTLGTGAFVQQFEGATATECAGLLNSVILQDGATVHYALEGTVNGAGAALAWFATQEGVAEAELLRQLPEWLDATREPPLFVNAVGGLAAPYWKAHATSRFIGASDLAGRAVAVLDSVAFLLAANLDAMRAAGRPVRRLVAVGGLARLDGLLLRIAALAGVPVLRAAQSEATAYGAARLAQPALPPLTTTARFEPDAALRERLLPRYQRSLDAWSTA